MQRKIDIVTHSFPEMALFYPEMACVLLLLENHKVQEENGDTKKCKK